MVGYTPEELRGGDYSRIAQGDFKGADRALAEAVRSGQVDQLQQELGYTSANGSTRQAMLSVSTVRDEQGRPSHVVGIFEDITRRREAERAKEEFVSVVGHELRTPLTSIRGSLGLLTGGLLGELPQDAANRAGGAVAVNDSAESAGQACQRHSRHRAHGLGSSATGARARWGRRAGAPV